jgi:hypothetical protein
LGLEEGLNEDLFSNDKAEDLKDTQQSEAETETITDDYSATGIVTPLDTMSIALRDGRRKN